MNVESYPMTNSLYSVPPGIRADFLEWQMNLLPGASVELIEIKPGAASLADIYVKPGTVLELEEIEMLEYKLAL